MRFKKLLFKKSSFSRCLYPTKYDCLHLPKDSDFLYIKKGRINLILPFFDAGMEGAHCST